MLVVERPGEVGAEAVEELLEGVIEDYRATDRVGQYAGNTELIAPEKTDKDGGQRNDEDIDGAHPGKGPHQAVEPERVESVDFQEQGDIRSVQWREK